MSEPPVVTSHQEFAAKLAKLWWLPLLRGVLLVIIGLYALLTPGMTVAALMRVAGVFIILDGFLAVAAGIAGETSSRGWTIARGAVAILVGVFVFAHPYAIAGIAATVLLTIIALVIVVAGVMEIVGAVRDRHKIEGEGWLILGGALAVLFGVLVFIAPLSFGRLIVQILGVYAIIFGISLVSVAFRVRRFGKALVRAAG
jgi:uncharacterized membrane protein HdeD (DUF308 family)